MATPIAASMLPDEVKALLAAISGAESPGYNVLYGGKTFDNYDQHPGINIPIMSGPYKGQTSSAAGMYQFIKPTWDSISKKYSLPDFSPSSQDMGAWHLARDTYAKATGGDLLDVLKSKDPARLAGIAPALRAQWPSLPGGDQPNNATGGFYGRLTGGLGMAQDGGGLLAAPVAPAKPPTDPTALHGAMFDMGMDPNTNEVIKGTAKGDAGGKGFNFAGLLGSSMGLMEAGSPHPTWQPGQPAPIHRPEQFAGFRFGLLG